jgi:phosphotransferase system enzyme I (PtsI)
VGAGTADGAAGCQFDEFEDAYLRERKHDVVQVVERVLKVLMGKPRKLAKRGKEEDLIIVAHDLSPADTIQFKNLRIGGFVTDLGGATSHTAIVARSLSIPAVVGMNHARPLIQDDDLLIVDGSRGVLIVEPDERVLEEYRLKKSELELEKTKLKRPAQRPRHDPRRGADFTPGQHRTTPRYRQGARRGG